MKQKSEKVWSIYLSGEIHTSWRKEIIEDCKEENLPITFYSPQLIHEASDNCGDKILGAENTPFWKDHKAAKINAIRTKTLLSNSDIVVVRFGEKYKQWNAAFDAGLAAAQGIPLIIMHDPALTHPLKEIDAAAMAVTQNTQQVIEIFKYITSN